MAQQRIVRAEQFTKRLRISILTDARDQFVLFADVPLRVHASTSDFSMWTTVPQSGADCTRSTSMNDCISAKPMPVRS